jgi:type II secretory ATPase GspE/PulE/Tfp pilus assembly ATPase PilB-like protein
MAASQDGSTPIFDDLMWRRPPDKLGFTNHELRRLGRLLVLERGLVLVAGPSGSGKTTTLYSAVRWTQTLRPADPNVVLVGEIRDREVAQLALRASNTGQLVLSTLHADDSASAIARLVEIGVDEVALGAALRGIIAQRLLRRVCTMCSVDVPLAELSDEQRQLFTLRTVDSVRVARGCADCDGRGYKGHMVVAEIAYITPVVERAIARRAETAEIASLCRLSGMKSLWDAALDRVVARHTTLQEVLDKLGAPPLEHDTTVARIGRTPGVDSPQHMRRATDRFRLTAILAEPTVQKRSIPPASKL